MERRLAERRAFSLPVEYDLGVTAGDMGAIHSAQSHDICADGLRIVTDFPLEKGAVLRLSFPVSGLQAPLPVFAEVAWATPANDCFNAGLRFLR
jgi:hypothetical protein